MCWCFSVLHVQTENDHNDTESCTENVIYSAKFSKQQYNLLKGFDCHNVHIVWNKHYSHMCKNNTMCCDWLTY